MLKKRILASSMASVMALTSFSAVAFADTTATDIGENNFGEKTVDDLKEYMESDYIQEKLTAGDYANGVTADFEEAYNYAENLVKAESKDSTQVTVAYRELQATAAKMTHHDIKELEELIKKAKELLGSGNLLEPGTNNPDLKYEALGYDNLQTATSYAQDVVDSEYDSKKRDVVDQAWEDLNNAIKGLKELPVAYLKDFKNVMAAIEKLQNQDTKYDAWTRVSLPEVKDSDGNVVKGYSGYTVAYGYFIWRMNDLSKKAQADFEDFGALDRSKTTISAYVDNYKSAQRLLAVFDAGVNQAKPIDGTKDRAYKGDIEALIGVTTGSQTAGTYHNRLVYDYANVDYANSETTAATVTKDDCADYTDGATELATGVQKNVKELMDQLLKIIDAKGAGWSVQYQTNAATINANGSVPAATWEDVVDDTTTVENLWCLNYGTDNKLGKAELKVKILKNGNSTGDVRAAYVYDAKGYIKGFYETEEDAKTAIEAAKGASSSEYAKGLSYKAIGGGSIIDLAKGVDLSNFLKSDDFYATDGTPSSKGTGVSSELPATSVDQGTTKVTPTDTNIGNGVRDGAASDTDNYIGWFTDFTSDVFGNGITASDDNSDHAPVGIKTDATVYTTVDFRKALNAAQYLLDNEPDKDSAGTISADYGKYPLILDVSRNGTEHKKQEIVDIRIDTNADWLGTFAKAGSNSKPYQWSYTGADADWATKAVQRTPTTAETTNVYNYVLYALTDAYGAPQREAAVAKLHTKEDVLKMVNQIRALTEKTYDTKLFNDLTDLATKAANDGFRWYGIADKNPSWQDNATDAEAINKSYVIFGDNDGANYKPQLFDGINDYYTTSHGHSAIGDVAAVTTGQIDLTATTTAANANSDQLYHALEGTYLKLYDLYTKFENKYQDVADLIAECEKDYAGNKSKQTTAYKNAITECAYWLSVVKAPTWGDYTGDTFEAYSVSREFLGKNRINGISGSDANHQSDSQAALLKAYENLKKAKAGDTDVKYMRGDADGNGTVNAADASAIIKHLLAKDGDSDRLTGTKLENAAKASSETDTNSNPNASDVNAIIKYLNNNNKWD